MNSNLLILGAGQYGCVVKEIAESMNCFSNIDFLDDNNPNTIGKISELDRYTKTYTYAIVAIGNSKMRLQLLNKLSSMRYQIPIIVSPSAYVSPSATLGVGTIVEPMSVIQSNAKIGMGCLICSGAVVKHNAVVEDGCYIDCNATILPQSTVSMGTKVVANFAYKIVD